MNTEWKKRVTVCVNTADDQYGFGPGMAELMERVRTHGSLRAAAESMDMAYSKAWRILKTAERVFHTPLLICVKGGQNGGGAALTPEGERILAAYQSMTAEVEQYSARQFARYFAPGKEEKEAVKVTDQQKIVQALTENRLFQNFPPRAVAQLTGKLEPLLHDCEPGQTVAREGTPIRRAALVLSGCFVATRMGNENTTCAMKIFRRGDVIGLPELVSTPRTWARSCTCTEGGTLLWITLSEILEESRTQAEIRNNLCLRKNLEGILADSSIKLFYRMEVLSTNPLRERILLFLRLQREKQGGEWVKLSMNRGQFAEYLAVDRATLSRELWKLERSGTLQLDGDDLYKIAEKREP